MKTLHKKVYVVFFIQTLLIIIYTIQAVTSIITCEITTCWMFKDIKTIKCSVKTTCDGFMNCYFYRTMTLWNDVTYHTRHELRISTLKSRVEVFLVYWSRIGRLVSCTISKCNCEVLLIYILPQSSAWKRLPLRVWYQMIDLLKWTDFDDNMQLI